MTEEQLDMPFDHDLRELFDAGPRVAPPLTLERAIARSEVVAQRRPRFVRLDQRAWPPGRRSASDPSVHRLARLALAALLIVVMGVVIAVGAQLLDRLPTPAPSLTPSPTLRPTSALAMTIEQAGTIELRFRDRFPLRLWPDGRILVGDEYLFDLATGTSEMLAAVLPPGPSLSVYPLADGRVVLIDDKDTEGAPAQGEHPVAVLDPASGEVTDAGRLPTYTNEQRLVLRDGRIFGSGGHDIGLDRFLDAAYVFDIETGTTTQLGPLRQPRVSHVMVELLDGRVLLVGGERPDTDLVPGPLTWVELYDLEAGSSAPVADSPLTDGWGALYPYTQLGDGRVVLGGRSEFTEPCPDLPRPTGGLIGGSSERVIVRLQTVVFDPATGTLDRGPLVPPPTFAFVPIGGERVLISREERAFASCAADTTSARFPWLGIADFGSGTILGSPNPITGEGALDVDPPIVYTSGLLLPDGRVALMDDVGDLPGPRRIDVLSIDP